MSDKAPHIKQPYTLAEIKERIASNDYSAELMLQHAMLIVDAQAKELEAVGAGGVQALSAGTARWKLVTTELLREARDNCKASIAEDGISSLRKEYRVDLEARLTTALAASPTPPAEQQAAPKAAPGDI